MAQPQQERSPWTRPGFIVAALVIALVLILGIVVGFNAMAGDEPAPRATTTVTGEPSPTLSTETPADDAEAGEESVCGLEAVELEGTLTAAPDVDWELVGRIAAPTSAEHGPGDVDQTGLRSCFSRTPTGALLAAANIAAMGSAPELSQAMARHFIAPGPGRDAAIADATATSSPEVSIQVAGFRVASYTGDTAVIDLAFRASNGALLSYPQNLVWSDGDWKIEVAADGQLLSPIAQISSLTGYTLWSGA